MNGGDQIHWTFIIPSHSNKTSMASPDVISTVHPLFHRRGDDNVLGEPFPICPYGFTGKYFFGFKLQKKDEGHSKNCPYISCDTCPQSEQGGVLPPFELRCTLQLPVLFLGILGN